MSHHVIPTVRTLIYDKDFTPFTPTLVIAESVGAVTVVTKLFGELTPERVAKERKETAYRAQQLAPIEKRPQRERVIPARFDDEGRDTEREMPRRRVRGEKRRRSQYDD